MRLSLGMLQWTRGSFVGCLRFSLVITECSYEKDALTRAKWSVTEIVKQ
jgi:hypothetical protein